MIRPVLADGRIDAGGAFTPIIRPRVIERIAAAALQRIVLIVAPAGYGKSVALKQYLDSAAQPSVRYDLSTENASLLGFVRGLSDALGSITPDARKTVSGAYEKSASSKTPGVDLALWMHAHLKAYSGLIAIDDLQIAENDPEVSKFVVSLIDRTKGKIRWAIASRSTMDLPVGSWLAYGEMDLTIDDQDLRFTQGEARQAALSSRVSVRDEELNEILAMTEGWPTALSFALRSSTRSVDLRNISASTREMIYRYLAEQVYHALTDAEREILHFSAYLPEIDTEILRAAGYSNSKALIEALRDRVAFIYADRPNVYRCHDLFKEFLHHQLELKGDPGVAEVQSQVALCFESVGRPQLALRMYAKNRSTVKILSILVKSGFDLIEEGHSDAVMAALDVLPQQIRSGDPIVLGLRALLEADAGRLDRAQALFERALARKLDIDLESKLTLRLALLLVNLQKDATSILGDLIAKEGLSLETRGEALSLLSAALVLSDRKKESVTTVAEAKEILNHTDCDATRSKMLQRLAFASSECNDLDYARLSFSESAEIAIQAGLYSLAARAYSSHANLSARHDDDIPRALWLAQQAVNAASKAGDALPLQSGLIQILGAETKRGNVQRVRAIQQQLVGSTTSDPARAAAIIPSRSFMAAWENRFDEAHRLLSPAVDRQPWAADRLLCRSFCALFFAVDGKREDALRSIEIVARESAELTASCVDDRHVLRQADMARSISALAECLLGRTSFAARLLQRKRLHTSPATVSFYEFVSNAVRLVRSKTASPAEDYHLSLETLGGIGYGGYARAMDLAVHQHLHATDGVDRLLLTRAEREVLLALAEGKVPKDIAQQTGRSVFTVQAHIQNITTKLDCSGRQEALVIARQRGLLDSQAE